MRALHRVLSGGGPSPVGLRAYLLVGKTILTGKKQIFKDAELAVLGAVALRGGLRQTRALRGDGLIVIREGPAI